VLLLIFAVMAFKVFGAAASTTSSSSTVPRAWRADVEPNRLEAAKRLALEEIDRHTDSDIGMVVAFGGRASLLQEYTNRPRPVGATRSTRSKRTAQPTRLEEALRLAESLAKPIALDRRSFGQTGPGHRHQGRGCIFTATAASPRPRAMPWRSFASGNLDIIYHRLGKPGGRQRRQCRIQRHDGGLPDAKRSDATARLGALLNFRKESIASRSELRARIWARTSSSCIRVRSFEGAEVHPTFVQTRVRSCRRWPGVLPPFKLSERGIQLELVLAPDAARRSSTLMAMLSLRKFRTRAETRSCVGSFRSGTAVMPLIPTLSTLSAPGCRGDDR